MWIFAVGCAVALVVYYIVYSNRISHKAKRRTEPRTLCSVCGTPSVVWEGQYCSPECEARLAKSMDDWHDRSEESE